MEKTGPAATLQFSIPFGLNASTNELPANGKERRGTGWSSRCADADCGNPAGWNLKIGKWETESHIFARLNYQLVIFDFDGTLADSFPWFAGILDHLADEFQFSKLTESDYDVLRGCDSREVLRRLSVPFWKVPRIATRMRDLVARDCDQIRLFGGIDRLLLDLERHGATLAVVSSNSESNIRRILGPENAARIQHYGCGTSLFGKPVKLRKVLRRSGVEASRAIYIGDEIRDAAAAREVKIDFGAVSWGYTKVEALQAQSPRIVFDSVEEILCKLQRNGSNSLGAL